MSAGTQQQQWHYLVGTDVRGPVTFEELSRLIASGSIPGSVLVATPGADRWQPAADIFRAASGGPPPPPPPPPPPDAPGKSFLDQIGDTINQVAGTEKLEGFKLGEVFSEAFTRRSAAEMEEYLIIGTARTTPAITDVQTGWPKPWLFMRFLIFCVIIYAGFVYACQHFSNIKLVPGLIFMGAFSMPLATLILFFELNTPRNVSIYRLIILLGLGSVVSLGISLFGYDTGALEWLKASSAGIIEELGKLLTLLLIVRGTRYKYILNGMLFGAAVGAGFGAFETAGYAFSNSAGGDGFLEYYIFGLAHTNNGSEALLFATREATNTIWIRGLLAPLMHVAWTAMVGAALWRVKGDKPISREMFLNPRFYRVLLLAMALHMLWNWGDFRLPYNLKYLLLGAVAWFVIFGLVQQGLRQVRDEQRAVNSLKLAAPPPDPPKSP